MKKNKIIIFSPHFDDALISCGGLINNKLRKLESLNIVTIFSGKPDYKNISNFAATIANDAWVERRAQENRRVLKSLNIEIKNLDFLDAIFRRNDKNENICISWSDVFSGNRKKINKETKLIVEIKKKINKIVDATSGEVYFPLSLGSHIDHVLINIIGQELSLSHKNLAVYFYEDLPYADQVSATDKVFSDYRVAKVEKINISKKLAGIVKYKCGLEVGDDARSKMHRIKKYAASISLGRNYQERFWKYIKK